METYFIKMTFYRHIEWDGRMTLQRNFFWIGIMTNHNSKVNVRISFNKAENDLSNE